MRASARYEVSVDVAAPRMYWNPIQEPCCAALAEADDGLVAAAIVLSVLPLVYLLYRDVVEASKTMLDGKRGKRAFYTRAELLGASRADAATR
jgi:hypothetical protein